MSYESLAISRSGLSQDLKKLAEQHLQHDLQQSDRDALESAARKLSTHVAIGSAVGIGLGLLLAFRLRSNRVKMFNAFRATQKPTHVRFADGREEAIPDITPLLKPSTLGDIATYTFFSAAGIFLGGEVGVLTGASAAKRTILHDPESRGRIETAFKAFRVDMLKEQIQMLESGRRGGAMWPEA